MESKFYFQSNNIEALNFCDRNIGFEVIGGIYQPPFAIIPTKGEYHNYLECKGCQSNHEKIKLDALKFYDKFPNCCEKHKLLYKMHGFDRKLYEDTSTLVADKVIFTKNHYMNCLPTDDWYNEITDYFTFVVHSFGSIPVECGSVPYANHFFHYIKQIINNLKVDKKLIERKKRILHFINNYGKVDKDRPKVSLNVLVQTYEKWYKIFPFELSFFKHLKQDFSKIPIGIGKPHYNKYLEATSIKPFTKNELIDFLLNLTNQILTNINTKTLYEQGKLTEPNKIKLELILQSRELKIKKGYINKPIDDEQQYRKILKSWFNDEKQFISELIPLLNDLPPQNDKNTEAPKETETENDVLESTIEDYLFDFKERMLETDYTLLVSSLKTYFTTGQFPTKCSIIKIKGKVNIKKFGWALNQLYRSEKNGTLPYEYLLFAKNNISIFKSVSFNNKDYKKTTLYKYFTTKQ
ncbi:MAG: hypothetical protein H6553_05270 [Chitinophagales bacterium]|nr:hypothetical protein [Chitinophagales bacterium]